MPYQPAPVGTAPSGLDNFCGPAAIATITGWSRNRAADEIAHVSDRKGYKVGRNGSTTIYALYHVLKEVGYQVELDSVHRDELGKQPTVARWIRENRSTYAIILAARHFMVVRDGEIVEDNSNRPMRGRVRWVLTINDVPEDAPEPQPVKPAPKTVIPNAVRYLHRLAGPAVGTTINGASTVHLDRDLQLDINWDVTDSGGHRVRTYLWNTATGKRMYVSQAIAKRLIAERSRS